MCSKTNSICHFSGLVYEERDITGILQSVVPITRTNMMCTGYEDTISQCSFDGADGDTCTHKNDIIIFCTRKQFNAHFILYNLLYLMGKYL